MKKKMFLTGLFGFTLFLSSVLAQLNGCFDYQMDKCPTVKFDGGAGHWPWYTESWDWTFGDGTEGSGRYQSHTYNKNGTYKVTLSTWDEDYNHEECSFNIVIDCIEDCRLPKADFTFSALGLTTSFKNTSTGSPTSYNWTFGDGRTRTKKNPKYTYAVSGTYSVCLIATNSCGPDTICKTVTVTSGTGGGNDGGDNGGGAGGNSFKLGINDNDNLNNYFSISPNPSSGNLTISFDKVIDNSYAIRIVSMLGQTVKQIKPTGQLIEVDLSDLDNGVYFVNISNSEGFEITKVIKQ